MQVTEVFRSIQGESTYAGLPCVFVRLTGCNLRCTWCDTAYAFSGGRKMTLEEVMEAVREFSDNEGARRLQLVEITGGEPLLQKEVVGLMERLSAEGYRVLVETSGERYIGHLPPEVIRIVDVKCPGSGEGGTFCMDNLGALNSRDQLKFVLAERADYEWARQFLHRHPQCATVEAVIFSPVFDKLEPRRLAEWILADGLPVRLGLQLHKFIWHPDMQGV
jgi:7-carboxy-7-deazaguanine synthase